MILGIGTDILSKLRIYKFNSQKMSGFSCRVLTPSELEIYNSKKQDNLDKGKDYLIKRFAGKEAISKALGCGIGKELSFQDIEILNDELGAPKAKIIGRDELKIHISLSDEKEGYAIAFAIIETDD